MQQLESKHKSELSTHFRNQERELEQLWAFYERDQEKLRSRQKAETDQKVGVTLIYRLENFRLYIPCFKICSKSKLAPVKCME